MKGEQLEAYSESRGRVSRIRLQKTTDNGKQQLVDYKGVRGEQHTQVLRVQYFGLSTHAPPGSEGILITMGHRDMPVVLGLEHPDHRPTDTPEGAAVLYDAKGTKVTLDGAGGISIQCEGTLKIKAGKVVIDAPVETTSSITSDGAHKASAHT